MTEGEYICDEYWLNHVPRTGHWYWVGKKKTTVQLQQILHANLSMAERANINPLLELQSSTMQQISDKICMKLDMHDHDCMMDTAELRGKKIDFEQLFNRADGEMDGDDDAVKVEVDREDDQDYGFKPKDGNMGDDNGSDSS